MLSIVIPTLNESAMLRRTIEHTRSVARSRHVELILSDCGSVDGTCELAQRLEIDRLVTGGSCRATGLNRGAAIARGDVLLFLHADSMLPEGFDERVRRALARDAAFVGGAFDFRFDVEDAPSAFDRHCLEWVILLNRARFRWTGNFYGDQSIFVRRDVFDRIGGFPPVKLMEDIRFSRRMRRYGRTAILRPPVVTSPRRFLAHGVIGQLVRDMTLLGFDSMGICPDGMWRKYNELNHRGHAELPLAT